ncbi:MAG: zinc-binding dehydrogenase [Actinomycetota bacterium]
MLVEVAGAGVNRADLLQRMGRYAAPPGWPQDVPGLEFSGIVVEAGPSAIARKPGDRVFGISGGGAQAAHLAIPESLCVPAPEGMDLVEAGGIPEVFVTAHDAMLVQAGLRPGERVLIHGVGSGVGTAAVQLAHAIGAVTVGTSRTPAKLERAKELGLDEGVLSGDGMAERIGEVDVVIELVGGGYLETDLRVCRTGGRIVIVGLLAGPTAELDMATLMNKRLSVRGTTLRLRPDHLKAAALERFAREVVPLFGRGLLRTVVEAVMPLDEGQDAYDLVASDRTFGKVILRSEG